MFKRLKRIYTDAFKILKEDFLYYIGILMLARFISLEAIKQISTRIFQMAISSISLVSINSDNISEIFKHPLTLTVLFIAILSGGFFMLLENAIILNFANRFYSGTKTNLKKIFAVVFRPSSILFTAYLILILPNVEFGMSASYLSNFQIPRFMVDAIYEQKWMTYTYLIILTLAFIASLYLYYLPAIYLLEEDISFIDAAKKSIKMIKGELFEVIFFKWTLGFAVLAFSILSYGFAFGFVWLATKLNLPWIHLIKSISTSLFFISLIFSVSLEKILSYLSLLTRYHLKRGEAIKKIDAPAKKFMNDLLWIGTLLIFVSGVVVAYNYNDNKLIHRTSLVAAHRGDTSRAIENTIESLTFANEVGADLVELDIQKTKDDVIVVFHDDSLARLSRNKKRVDELTFEEISHIELNNGKFKAKMPDFDTYLKKAKELDQGLLLELKSIRTNVDAFVHETIALIDKV